MKTAEFTVYGEAQSKGNMKPRGRWIQDEATGRKFWSPYVHDANPKLKAWEDSIAAAIQLQAAGVHFDGPVSVRLEFHVPRPDSAPKRVRHPIKRPDIDKLVRGALDACTGPLWNDDSQVVQLVAFKVFARSKPKVRYRIEEVVEDEIPADDWQPALPL